MEQNDNDNNSSVRLNIRIPKAQYELMKKYGEVIGLTSDSACIKHFFTIGLQGSASTFSSIVNTSKSVDFMDKFMALAESEKGDN